METIQGKHARTIDALALEQYLAAYQNILIDLGTGDGRFVQQTARSLPDACAIGVDACRENLRAASRNAPANALFLIANALELPRELYGKATAITINFPWGTLLGGLLAEDGALPRQLRALALPGATVEVRLNGGALAEQGWTLEAGAAQVERTLRRAGFAVRRAQWLGPPELKAFPSSWAHRLAFGRDPRAVYLKAR